MKGMKMAMIEIARLFCMAVLSPLIVLDESHERTMELPKWLLADRAVFLRRRPEEAVRIRAALADEMPLSAGLATLDVLLLAAGVTDALGHDRYPFLSENRFVVLDGDE